MKTRELTLDGVKFSVRKPSYHEWRAFKSSVATAKVSEEGSHLIDAQENLAKSCCTSHKPEQLDTLVEDNLDLFTDLADAVSDLAARKSVELDSKS
jgi:hypothetical protein